METRVLLDIVAVALILLTAGVIFSSFSYVRKQTVKCQKYPFFRLRDKIVYSIATSDDPVQYERVYTVVNDVIGRLRIFNFTFYSFMLARSIDAILEEGHKCNFDDDRMSEALKLIKEKGTKIGFHEKEFLDLTLRTARENSVLLRVAMTKTGHWFLFNVHAFVGILRFLKRHPNIKTDRNEAANPIETARLYSGVQHTIRTA